MSKKNTHKRFIKNYYNRWLWYRSTLFPVTKLDKWKERTKSDREFDKLIKELSNIRYDI